jgi:hypothetical protein
MKKLLYLLSIVSLLVSSCSYPRNMTAIEPKSGKFNLPAKGELRVWKGTFHPSFTVTLVNPAPNQSCEVYYVKSDGTEKWINPSLLANSKLTVKIPTDGHLFFKNFNDNVLTISYQVNE